MLFFTLVVETGLYSNFLLELAHRDTTTDPQLQELYCIWPWHFVLVAFAQTTSNTLSLAFFFKARFHYERGKEHSFSLLLIFD